MSLLFSFLILITFLLSLFFLARLLSKTLYLFFFLLTNNQNTSIHLLAYFLLAGTLVHEISHLFMAGVLGVSTGELSIIPEIEDQEVKVGTLKIAKVDPFRRTLVGLAPTLIGTTLIVFINNFFLNLQNLTLSSVFNLFSSPLNLVFCYLLLVISLSMFSSRKDLEAIFIPLFVFFCFGLVYYLSGLKLIFPEKFINSLNLFLQNLNLVFLFTLFLELFFLFLLRLLLLLSQRLLKKYVKI